MPNNTPVFLQGVAEVIDPGSAGIDLPFGTNVELITFDTDGANLSANQTVYFGHEDEVYTLEQGAARIPFIQKGRIVAVEITATATGDQQSDEDWPLYVSKNGDTDYLIDTQSVDGGPVTWTNNELDIVVDKDDYIEFKSLNPDWATPPESVVFTITYYFRTEI